MWLFFFGFQNCCSLFGDLCAIFVRKFFLPIFLHRLSGWCFLLVVIIIFIGARLSRAVLILFTICFICKCTQNAIIMFRVLEITFCEHRLTIRRSFSGEIQIFFVNLVSIPTNSNIWSITVKCMVPSWCSRTPISAPASISF